MSDRLQRIKEHFEKEAKNFDKRFFKVVPHYEEMLQALVDALPFHGNDKLQILDLGCGTGNLTQKLLPVFPKARVTCVDISENMFQMARAKFGENPKVDYWLGDVRDFKYPAEYDAILGSLVLHHIEPREKPRFYRGLRKALSQGGVFYNIDILLSPNEHLRKLYLDRWKLFMKANGLPARWINGMIARSQTEDRPAVFEDELAMLRKAGFTCVDVLFKNYSFALYGGIKS